MRQPFLPVTGTYPSRLTGPQKLLHFWLIPDQMVWGGSRLDRSTWKGPGVPYHILMDGKVWLGAILYTKHNLCQYACCWNRVLSHYFIWWILVIWYDLSVWAHNISGQKPTCFMLCGARQKKRLSFQLMWILPEKWENNTEHQGRGGGL